MGLMPKKWIKWMAVVLGVAGLLTPLLFDLGWIPQNQSQSVVIFLLGFLVLDGAAARESSQQVEAPELFDNSTDFYDKISGLLRHAKHEYLSIIRPNEISAEHWRSFMSGVRAAFEKEKQLHFSVILAGTPEELNEEAFQRRMAIERDVSLEGRYHYRFIDLPVTFGCVVIDNTHWAITFPSQSTDRRVNAGILFKNHPDEARLVASFIRHQWIEQPGVTMSISEAYEKWKTIQATATATEPNCGGSGR
jgi:hypothetical protein